MADNRKGKDKRYYFSRAQMVLLGAVFTIASVIIFFLGMVVGKGIEERKIIKAEEPLMKIPIKPGQPSGGSTAASQPREELTFYDTLTKPPAPAPLGEEKPKPEPQENSGKRESRDAARKASEAPSPTARMAAEKSAEPGEKTAVKKTAGAEKPPERILPLKTAEKEKAKERSAPAQTKTAESAKDQGRWTVQVNAFPEEKSAKSWVDRLRNKGYNAYMAEIQNKGKTWYRVRVGRYSSREEAEKIEEALKTKENFPKAFATGKADG
ncbi:MAG: SPOR domain-containing protein [Candidatus Binatia bacterium]